MEIEYGERITNFPFLFYGRGMGGKVCVRGARMVQWREHRLTSLIAKKVAAAGAQNSRIRKNVQRHLRDGKTMCKK